jgi:hypothetical protein
MSENSRRGVAVVQWQIVDPSRSMSWDYLLRALVVIAASGFEAGADRSFSSRPGIS